MKNETNNRKYLGWGIAAIVLVLLSALTLKCISVSNEDVRQRNMFAAKFSKRTAFFDKMKKIFAQKAQIAVKNDSSFARNIELIMTGRKDAEGIMMKWITESNPNANFSEVSALYKDLSRAVEAERDGFFVIEQELQDVKMQNDNLIKQFPGSVLFAFMGRTEIEYKPITSDETDEVIKSGKDNNTKLF